MLKITQLKSSLWITVSFLFACSTACSRYSVEGTLSYKKGDSFKVFHTQALKVFGNYTSTRVNSRAWCRIMLDYSVNDEKIALDKARYVAAFWGEEGAKGNTVLDSWEGELYADLSENKIKANVTEWWWDPFPDKKPLQGCFSLVDWDSQDLMDFQPEKFVEKAEAKGGKEVRKTKCPSKCYIEINYYPTMVTVIYHPLNQPDFEIARYDFPQEDD